LISVKDGFQAQTKRYYKLARELNLRILFILNKVDNIEYKIFYELVNNLKELKKPNEDILFVSSKTNLGIEKLKFYLINRLKLINKNNSKNKKNKNARVIASFNGREDGYHLLIKNEGNILNKGDKLKLKKDNQESIIKIRSLYINSPTKIEINELKNEEIGYIITSSHRSIKVGSILGDFPIESQIENNLRYKAILIPKEEIDYEDSCSALEELADNDYSIKVKRNFNSIFGKSITC